MKSNYGQHMQADPETADSAICVSVSAEADWLDAAAAAPEISGQASGGQSEGHFLNIKKILLPLDLQDTEAPVAIIHQAAALVRHFKAQLVILHVVRPLSYLGGETAHELLEDDLASEQARLKKYLGTDVDGAKSLVLKGNPAEQILRVVQQEPIDLIVMPTHGYGAFDRFMLGSVTSKVLHKSECPVWTGAHVKDVPVRDFAIRNVLCAVDFGDEIPRMVRRAHDVASEFGAELTLAHITPGMEIYGPGGYHELPQMKQELVSSATRQMEKIQHDTGTKAKIYVGSGDVSKGIDQAVKETKADLVVVGRRSLGGRFGTTAYGIIRESSVPVLSV